MKSAGKWEQENESTGIERLVGQAVSLRVGWLPAPAGQPKLQACGHNPFRKVFDPSTHLLLRSWIVKNVNEDIQAATVRAVFPDGTMEVIPTHLAVRRAQAMGLDLVLIAPNAAPPI